MRVVDPGFYSLVQDYPGRAASETLGEFWRIGIPPSGPADDFSFRLANALVGNSSRAAGLEFTVHGPSFKMNEATIISITGADFSATLDGEPCPLYTSVAVKAGATLSIGLVKEGSGGQRGYLAVAGGFDVPLYLGSRSTFPLGKMGGHQGRPLVSGDVLPLACDPKMVAAGGGATCPAPEMPSKDWKVGCVLGPHGAPDFLTDDDMVTSPLQPRPLNWSGAACTSCVTTSYMCSCPGTSLPPHPHLPLPTPSTPFAHTPTS